jgi:hypothetical protein
LLFHLGGLGSERFSKRKNLLLFETRTGLNWLIISEKYYIKEINEGKNMSKGGKDRNKERLGKLGKKQKKTKKREAEILLNPKPLCVI